MNTGRENNRGMEKSDDFNECPVRGGGFEKWAAVEFDLLRDNKGRSLGLFQGGKMFLIGNEGDVTFFCMVHPGETGDAHRAVSDKGAFNLTSQFCKAEGWSRFIRLLFHVDAR